MANFGLKLTDYKHFNRENLELTTLQTRKSYLTLDGLRESMHGADLTALITKLGDTVRDIKILMRQMLTAKELGGQCVLFMGAHAIKAGLGPLLGSMILDGWFTHVALNGAAVVHEYELFNYGHTSEDVSVTLPNGKFGLWTETQQLNTDIQNMGVDGLGESAGLVIRRAVLANGCTIDQSVFASAIDAGVPITVHIIPGSDINHMYPNFNPRIWGERTYRDFLRFAGTIKELDKNGVYINMGSATIGPELFQKSLSMAKNVGGAPYVNTTVIDKPKLPDEALDRDPTSDDPLYYYRPWKTLLRRAVADGGEANYICGDLEEIIPYLQAEIS